MLPTTQEVERCVHCDATLVLGLASAAMAQTADLKVGDQAPNFKLQATDGKTYQLSDFKGKKPVVVAWFPRRSPRLHD
jgi:peroxiredoxin Q/BCP